MKRNAIENALNIRRFNTRKQLTAVTSNTAEGYVLYVNVILKG